MARQRGWGVLVVAGWLLAAGCASESDGSGPPQQVVTADLETALATTAAAPGYRVAQSNGQVISSTALGVDTARPIDEENPTLVGEVTAGASHVRMDLAAIFEPMFGDVPPMSLEMWTGPDRLVLDTRAYAVLSEQNPTVDLGPFDPGISFVDLDALRGDEDLLAAVAGQGMVDLRALADRLPDVLDDVEQDGGRFTGTAGYGALVEAMGTDLQTLTRSLAGGVALALQVDPAPLAAFYSDYFGDIDAEVAVEVGPDDTVRSLRFEVDLSGIFSALFEEPGELDLGIPSDELDDAQAAFADTVWTMETLVRFEVEEDLRVAEPPPATDDRTEEWLEFLEQSGF